MSDKDLGRRIKAATHDYVGRCPVCRGWVMLRVDTGDRDTARDVAECIRGGIPVERLPHAEIKKLAMCEHHGQCKPGEPRPPTQGRLF